MSTPATAPPQLTNQSMSFTSTTNKLAEFFRSKRLIIILGLIVTAIVGFIVAWVIYTYIKTKTIDRKVYIIPDTKDPVLGTVVTKGDGSGIPDTLNGHRFTFSFWIYIHNLSKNAGIRRHILHRGSESAPLKGSPTVFLDPNLNKLSVLFDSTKEDDFPSTITTDDHKLEYQLAKRGITIDYIPLQRWVHVAIVVNENSNGGSISAYVDAELVKSMTTNMVIPIKYGTTATSIENVNPDITNLDLDRKGTVFIGGSDDSAVGMGFSGLVSMVQFFNYDLNDGDIYNVYLQGPIYLSAGGKFANTIGIGGITNQYSVRNPIYKKPQLT
jgi:hypothetical protein